MVDLTDLRAALNAHDMELDRGDEDDLAISLATDKVLEEARKLVAAAEGVPCSACGGTGKIPDPLVRNMLPPFQRIMRPCPDCSGE